MEGEKNVRTNLYFGTNKLFQGLLLLLLCFFSPLFGSPLFWKVVLFSQPILLVVSESYRKQPHLKKTINVPRVFATVFLLGIVCK